LLEGASGASPRRLPPAVLFRLAAGIYVLGR
jgi:hypothetical protein